MKKRLILLAAGALLLAAGCDRKVTLNEPNWDPRVREALDALIADYGKGSPDYDPKCPPYAVLDFDNTTIINGAGDPAAIEARSMEIIASELKTAIPAENRAVVMRVIHATADFDYAENLAFSEGAVAKALDALRAGYRIVTDTQMAKAGINKTAAAKLGCAVDCFMSDPDVAEEAKAEEAPAAEEIPAVEEAPAVEAAAEPAASEDKAE